jgi:hypothetical protein
VLTALTPQDVPSIIAALRTGAGMATCHPCREPPFPRASCKAARCCLAGASWTWGLRAAKARDGTGILTGMKQRSTRKSPGQEHDLACNPDEGELAGFKDRALLADFPDIVFDGVTVAGYALGARQEVIYLRGGRARCEVGPLGTKICGGDGGDFEIRVQLGAGAFICAEESSQRGPDRKTSSGRPTWRSLSGASGRALPTVYETARMHTLSLTEIIAALIEDERQRRALSHVRMVSVDVGSLGRVGPGCYDSASTPSRAGRLRRSGAVDHNCCRRTNFVQSATGAWCSRTGSTHVGSAAVRRS